MQDHAKDATLSPTATTSNSLIAETSILYARFRYSLTSNLHSRAYHHCGLAIDGIDSRLRGNDGEGCGYGDNDENQQCVAEHIVP